MRQGGFQAFVEAWIDGGCQQETQLAQRMGALKHLLESIAGTLCMLRGRFHAAVIAKRQNAP